MSTRISTADRDVGDLPDGPVAHTRRNHFLGVLSGVIAAVARDFIHPEIIIAGMITALTGSWYLVALVGITSKAGSLAPQLIVSSFVEHKPRKLPYFIMLTFARAVSLVVMLGSMWMLTQEVGAFALALFFVAYFLIWVVGGAAHVIFLDMIGRMIPSRRMGSFLGIRSFLGGALAVLVSFLVIQPILKSSGAEQSLSPSVLTSRYFLLAVIGSILMLAQMGSFAFCREEDGPRAKQRTTFGESLRRGLRWLRTDRNYRTYLIVRIAFRVNYLGLAFFIPYGTERLKYKCDVASLAILGGIMVGANRISRVAASVIAGKLSDRFGFRAALTMAGMLFFLVPVLWVLAPTLPEGFSIPIPFSEATLNLPLLVYFLSLVSIGAAMQSNVIGGNHFLITTAPPHRRPSYVGFLNTIASPLTLLPLAGAWLRHAAGPSALVVVLALGGLIYLVGVRCMIPVKPTAPSPPRPVAMPDNGLS